MDNIEKMLHTVDYDLLSTIGPKGYDKSKDKSADIPKIPYESIEHIPKLEEFFGANVYLARKEDGRSYIISSGGWELGEVAQYSPKSSISFEIFYDTLFNSISKYPQLLKHIPCCYVSKNPDFLKESTALYLKNGYRQNYFLGTYGKRVAGKMLKDELNEMRTTINGLNRIGKAHFEEKTK